MRLTICAFVLSVSLAALACGRAADTRGGATTAPSTGADGEAPALVMLPDGATAPATSADADPVSLALWTKATSGDAESDDFARLAAHEGAGGLEAHLDDATSPTRSAAISALAYVSEEARFDALPRLADLATSNSDADATQALRTIEVLAARPHRAVDREDAIELRQGCDKLLAFAPTAPATRAPSISRILSMLRDYGCAAKAPAASP